MERKAMPSTPAPDEVTIGLADMKGTYPYLGLCSLCILNLNSNQLTRVGRLMGAARDIEGCSIRFPSGNYMQRFGSGVSIVPGAGWVSEIALTFGPTQIAFTDASGAPLGVWAVTMRDGMYLCDQCNGWQHQKGK